jgi:hypothetical protein
MIVAMEKVSIFETSVIIYQTKRCYIPGGSHLQGVFWPAKYFYPPMAVSFRGLVRWSCLCSVTNVRWNVLTNHMQNWTDICYFRLLSFTYCDVLFCSCVRFRTRMGQGRNVYGVLVGKPEGQRPLVRPRRRREMGSKRTLGSLLGGGVWSGFSWLGIGTVGGLLWMRWWTFGFWHHGFS